MRSAFALFGGQHLAALAVVALASAALTLALRPRRDWLPGALAVVLVAAGVGYPLLDLGFGRSWREVAPLHLCDVAVFVGAVALWTRRQLAYELLFFWGGAGTVAALLTPDLAEGFPSYRFVFYFVQHGAIVAALVLLTFGLGMRPRPRAPLWAFGWLNAYAALVFAFNFAFDTNFLYLRAPPGSATPLDWLGPWPWYIVSGDIIALLLFVMLAAPFRRAVQPG